ncbi:hypothetical protein AAC03nite_32460 [Alicyclobacillus acidoterrestris]|nr:hypothetical protein AAC03nite_32460 [Alicyclobacillus acidoterrestris]
MAATPDTKLTKRVFDGRAYSVEICIDNSFTVPSATKFLASFVGLWNSSAVGARDPESGYNLYKNTTDKAPDFSILVYYYTICCPIVPYDSSDSIEWVLGV